MSDVESVPCPTRIPPLTGTTIHERVKAKRSRARASSSIQMSVMTHARLSSGCLYCCWRTIFFHSCGFSSLAIERSQKHSTSSSINKAASKSQPPKDPSKPSGKSSNMLPTVSSPRSTAGGSFAAALAKKGVDVSKILEKSLVSVQGPTDERYFADLHGYRVV